MPATTSRRLTLADLMVLVASAAVGGWGATHFRAGIPLPLVDRPGFPLHPLFMSIPLAAALTWASLAIPVRALRERAQHPSRLPGAAVCIGPAAIMLGVTVRWVIRSWVRPYVDGSPSVYGAHIFLEWGSTCGLGVAAGLAVQVVNERLPPRADWVEGLRVLLGVYWVLMFLFLTAI